MEVEKNPTLRNKIEKSLATKDQTGSRKKRGRKEKINKVRERLKQQITRRSKPGRRGLPGRRAADASPGQIEQAIGIARTKRGAGDAGTRARSGVEEDETRTFYRVGQRSNLLSASRTPFQILHMTLLMRAVGEKRERERQHISCI